MEKVLEVKKKHTKELFNKKNVCGTAVGKKWVEGMPTDEPAILVFVQKKVKYDPNAISAFAAEDLVPPEIDGIPTDVIEVGDLVKHSLTKKVRPLRPGYSCGHEHVTAGTMGGFFLDDDNDVVILTNNHVAANENNAKVGDILYQPGIADQKGIVQFKGWTGNVKKYPYVGTLKKFVKINKTNNLQDSAIVKIHPRLLEADLVDDHYPIINRAINGFHDAKVDMQVQKCGRTTGYTTGRVLGLHATFTIAYDFGAVKFDDCIVTTAMSKGGDSGSIIMDMNMNAIGLLFAGSKKVTIANPIDKVVRHYGLKLWNGVSDTFPPIVTDGKIVNLQSAHWKQFTTSGKIAYNDNGNKITITEHSNKHCFLQCKLNSFNSISCRVNTGSERGATWGPGITIEWPTGMMKINLRYSTFGGYFNSNHHIDIGNVKPDTNYTLRIRKTNNTYIGEVLDNKKWYTVIELPLSIFPMNPVYLRIGKTGILGGTKDHATSGPAMGKIGTCTISNVRIN
jgi:hypothetical protein